MSGLWRQSGRTPVGPPTDRPPGTDGCLLACLLASVCAPTHLYLSSNPPLPLFVCMYVCAYRSVGRREGVGCDFAGWAKMGYLQSKLSSIIMSTDMCPCALHARALTYVFAQPVFAAPSASQSVRQATPLPLTGRQGRTDGRREGAREGPQGRACS